LYLTVSVGLRTSSDPLLRDYWVYEGSLTTPPCSENVIWILYRYPLTISQMQVISLNLLLNIIITILLELLAKVPGFWCVPIAGTRNDFSSNS